MTFDLLRPAVLLPSDSAGWPDSRRRAVLLHELAHVRRGDAATQLLARVALAFHWGNPLAWTAWGEFLKERERAADDLALNAVSARRTTPGTCWKWLADFMPRLPAPGRGCAWRGHRSLKAGCSRSSMRA